MYKCASATVTMHICMVTIARAFNILVFFFFAVLGMRERGVVSEEIIKNCKIINILLNKCVE